MPAIDKEIREYGPIEPLEDESIKRAAQQQQPVVRLAEVECKNYKRSATIGKLVKALCQAQLEYTPVRKESENPAFKRGDRVSKYADLFNLVSATRPALNKYGLTLLQFPNVIMGSKVLVVESLLAHESDEWVSCEIHLPAADERGYTAHSIGKAITYARRFSWGPLTAAVAEDDDDGNDASGQGSRQEAQDVAKRKIAELEAKKAEKASQQAPALVSSLFYTLPEKHNGNYAEFINLKEYTFHHAERGDALRLLFSTVMSKQFARTGTVLVPVDRLDTLLATLAGDMAIDVKKLEAPNGDVPR